MPPVSNQVRQPVSRAEIEKKAHLLARNNTNYELGKVTNWNKHSIEARASQIRSQENRLQQLHRANANRRSRAASSIGGKRKSRKNRRTRRR